MVPAMIPHPQIRAVASIPSHKIAAVASMAAPMIHAIPAQAAIVAKGREQVVEAEINPLAMHPRDQIKVIKE